MKHYVTYFKSFENRAIIKDYDEFLATLGEKGQENAHLLEQIDRITRLIDYNEKNLIKKFKLDYLKNNLESINNMIKNIDIENKENLYYTFQIPKSSGGMRTIEAPEESLKSIQRHIIHILKNQYYLLEHNNAQGYVNHKCTVTNARFHKESNHFARVDIKDFFPSINSKLIRETLPKLGMFTLINNKKEIGENTQKLLDIIIQVSTLRDSLPQGAVTSPYLSNLVMIPFDHCMIEYLRENHPEIIYTRYADDIFFSSYYAFADLKKDAKEKLNNIVRHVMKLAYGYQPFVIKEEKTKVTTKYGANRITGIVINKDNEISMGYKEKRKLKQDLAALIIEKKKKGIVNSDIAAAILGMFAYFKSIEPEYADYTEKTLLKKFNIKHNSIRNFLRNN